MREKAFCLSATSPIFSPGRGWKAPAEQQKEGEGRELEEGTEQRSSLAAAVLQLCIIMLKLSIATLHAYICASLCESCHICSSLLTR